MRKLLAPLVLLFLLIWLPAVAYASSGNDDVADLLLAIYRGIVGGEYFYAAAVALSLLTSLARRAWGTTGLVGAAILFAGSIAGTFAIALGAGQAVTWSLTWVALSLAFHAAGGYSVLQAIVRRVRPWLEHHTPGPLLPILTALLNLVDPPAPPAASSRAATVPLSVALLIGLVLASSCATVRHAGGAGAAAGIDCTSEEIQATVDEAGELARAFVLSTISGTGDVDTTALREAARSLKTEAWRCSLVAAIAAIAAAAESGQSTSAGPRRLLSVQPDPQLLRAAARDIAEREWGVYGPIVVESGQL